MNWCSALGFLSVRFQHSREIYPSVAHYLLVIMPAFSLDTVLIQRPGLLANTVDGETILMRLHPATYYGLAGTAHQIWHLLAQPRSGRAICSHLESVYAVDPDTCRIQVEKFLETLAAEDLLCVVASAAA